MIVMFKIWSNETCIDWVAATCNISSSWRSSYVLLPLCVRSFSHQQFTSIDYNSTDLPPSECPRYAPHTLE